MATLVRWDPFREMASLQNDMSRLMTSVFGTGNGESRSWMPAVDVWETEDEIVYAFDLPGIPENQISVEFEDGGLTISGERERTDEVSQDRLYRYERRFGSFTRTIGLPQGVSEDSIKADYKRRRARGPRAEAGAAQSRAGSRSAAASARPSRASLPRG